MSRVSESDLKKLSKYSKEEIIEALSKSYQASYIIAGLLSDLEQKTTDKLFEDSRKSIYAAMSAREAYSKWIKDMALKYGDGTHVKISALPIEEVHRGAKLEAAMKKAVETERKLDAKINKHLWIGGKP